MKQKAEDQNDHANSENDTNETSNEYENFENAVRRIMRQDPKEAERIRKENPPPDPDEKPDS